MILAATTFLVIPVDEFDPHSLVGTHSMHAEGFIHIGEDGIFRWFFILVERFSTI